MIAQPQDEEQKLLSMQALLACPTCRPVLTTNMHA
jgi:hypothetical protein